MRETPAEFIAGANRAGYPAADLGRYSYHTGAPLKPLGPDEQCPVLFRDLGLVATARFLRGKLRRLAGPQTPLLYLRTEAYIEPYTDHERIGRLVFLRPLHLAPWHSGMSHVFVASAAFNGPAATVAFVPGDVALSEAARLCGEMTHGAELREAFGGRRYDEAAADSLHRVEKLIAELDETEGRLGSLRQAFQASNRESRDGARREMDRLGITEHDLCAAWHHLPRERRDLLREARLRVSFPMATR